MKTPKLNAAQELRESEEKYRYLFENSLDLLVCLDPSGNIIDVNNSALKALGYGKSDVIGKHFSQFVPAKYVQRLGEDLASDFAGQPSPVCETEIRNKDGKFIFVEFAPGAIPLYEKGKLIGVMVAARDITARKQLERQLVLSERMAAVGQVVAGVSHEFNTLLAGIKKYLELVQKTKRKESRQDAMEKIRQNVERGGKITEDLLSFAKNIDQNEVLIRVKAAIEDRRRAGNPSSQLNRQIGQNIKALRKQRNITLKELAKRTGLSISLISQIENAKNAASVLTLHKIAGALEVGFFKLVEGV